jgi:hypothetical protein
MFSGFNEFETQNKVPQIINGFYGVASGGEE